MRVFYRVRIGLIIAAYTGLAACTTMAPAANDMGFAEGVGYQGSAAQPRAPQSVGAAPVKFASLSADIAAFSTPPTRAMSLPEPSEMIVTCWNDQECFIQAAQLCRGRHLSLMEAGDTLDGLRMHFQCSD